MRLGKIFVTALVEGSQAHLVDFVQDGCLVLGSQSLEKLVDARALAWHCASGLRWNHTTAMLGVEARHLVCLRVKLVHASVLAE